MKILSSFLATTFLLGAATFASAKPIKPNPEAEAHRAKMIEQYDANKDGKLDDAEKSVRRSDRIATRFDRLDTNDDGSISRAEFIEGADQRDEHRDDVKVRDHRTEGKAKGTVKIKLTKAQRAEAIKAAKVEKAAKAKAKKDARAKAKAAIVAKPATSV